MKYSKRTSAKDVMVYEDYATPWFAFKAKAPFVARFIKWLTTWGGIG